MRRFVSRIALGAAVLAALGTSTAPAVAAPPAPKAPVAMTWTLLGDGPSGTVHVGGGPLSDPYVGDTPTTSVLPLLCLRINNSPVPAGLVPDFYAGWARGEVAATRPIRGNRLTSRAVADQVCANTFGTGWRMAEFHDGRHGPNLEYSGGWSYYAYGDVPLGVRFWTAINDQASNPWS
ncbi:hypothetical protein ABT354_12955 [Streptomyces sp. NPDC000594]|uniref:hypothetical protein n=1 Tax=Streptomyces sp. NPDC000594 TaxID=3154261 RepID=UPI00332F6D17